MEAKCEVWFSASTRYKRASNEMIPFADAIEPRFLTRALQLDYDTMCGVDKFGNFFASRLPDDADDEMTNPTGNRILWDQGYVPACSPPLRPPLDWLALPPCLSASLPPGLPLRACCGV